MSARTDVRPRLVIQGNQERGSLARAGLRLTGDVAPGERDGQRLRLNRRAVGETGIANTLQDGRGEAEAVEGGRVWISHQESLILLYQWGGGPCKIGPEALQSVSRRRANGPHLPAPGSSQQAFPNRLKLDTHFTS
jgi:hypothetical protein